MSEKYRIICRPLRINGKTPENGKVRALLLRDPTPDGSTIPSPFLPKDPGGEIHPQWLPDWRHTLVLPHDDVFRTVKYQRVVVEEVGDSKEFAISEAENLQGARIQLFQPFRDLLSEATPDANVVEATGAFSAEAKSKPEGSDDEVDLGCPGIAALLDVYWSDEDLDVLAQMGVEPDGRPGVITMAVLSGFVIDLSGMPKSLDKVLEGKMEENGVESLKVSIRLLVQDDGLQKLSLPLELHQSAAGCHIRVDWNLMKKPEVGSKRLVDHWFCYHKPIDGFDVDKPELEDATLVLFRSVGPVASGGEKKVGRFPVMARFKRLLDKKPESADNPQVEDLISTVFDALGAKRFVGERLHYRLELRNAVDAVVASGYIADERLRLDHPLPPPFAEALIDKDNKLTIRMEYPDVYTNLEPIVWYQRRALDPCGYYGTDDDMALEEGLRQADMNYSSQAEEFDVEGDWADMPAFQSLQGKFGKYGLHELSLKETKNFYDEGFFETENRDGAEADSKEKGRWRKHKAGDAPSRRRRVIANLDLPGENEGYRLYVGWRRTNGGESAPESKLKLCAHFLKRGAEDGELRRVFQLENVPKSQPDTKWLKTKDITLMLCDGGKILPQPNEVEAKGKAKPYTVRISVHAAEHAKGDLGGFRIFARDILGPSYKEPFRGIGEYEVITSSVYRYRPYRLDQSRTLLPPADIKPNWDYPTAGKRLDKVDAWFQKLAKLLQDPGKRNQLGHLVVDPGKALENENTPDENRKAAQPPVYSKVVVDKLVAKLRVNDITAPSFPPALPQGLDTDAQEKWNKVNQDLRSSWDLLGPFLRWAVDAGFARDLILPYSISRTDQLMTEFDKLMDEHKAMEMSVRVFAVSFPQPAAQALVQSENDDLVMATVRILVIPDEEEWPEINGGDAEWTKLLKWALKCALTGSTGGGGELRVFREAQIDPDWLVMDPRGWASLEWDGIGDTWHHRLEFAVERMDRYRKARIFLNPEPESSPGASSEADPPKEKRKTLEVNRREPPPGPPGILPITDPYRVGFRILETEQREAASHNALAQMRYGDVALMTRLTVSFPWGKRYGEELTALVSSQTTGVAGQPVKKWEKWNGSDIVEERHAPFFLSFKREVRWKADNLLGKEASASWQRQPSCISSLGKPTIKFVTIDGVATLTCQAPIIRLWDLLTKDERRHPLAEHEWITGKTAKILPDLETTYTLLHRPADGSPYRKVFDLIPPKPGDVMNNVFGYTPSANMQVTNQTLSVSKTLDNDQWQIVLTGFADDFNNPDWKWVITRNELNMIVGVGNAN